MTQDGYDYIIVGSGAGGAPLASRLALAGKRVLVIEAGSKHLESEAAHEVSRVPGFHGLASEHPGLTWRYFVKHYAQPPVGDDPKAYPRTGESTPDGIFYPRSSGIGGCTVHNAMITIAGPDSDWEDLADFVADDSWRGASMRAYFQRLERNEYHRSPRRAPTRWFGQFRDIVRWLFGFPPDYNRGKHGFNGWLHTSLTDLSLGLGDKQLLKILAAALWEARSNGLGSAWTLARRFLKGQGFVALDPNHSRKQAQSPEGVVLVPLAVCGKATPLEADPADPFSARGRRSSPREFLLATQASHPDSLDIWTDALVSRVLFDDGLKPRAIGVQLLRGKRLYGAHDREKGESNTPPATDASVFVREGGEVILCAGAFNTPQLLMLSGIGDPVHLNEIAGSSGADACVMRGRDGIALRDAQGLPRRVPLSGVGRNLQDRYEVTLVNEISKPFRLLDGATFALPSTSASPDRHLEQWRTEGSGLYTSNGAVLGIFRRSNPDLEQPDLFIFGIPLPFQGYELGYSGVGQEHQRFTWAILKSHTRNTDGTVRLRSADPRVTPAINFHYFNEISCAGKSDADPDLKALVEGVKFVRAVADRATKRLRLPFTFTPVVTGEAHPGFNLVPEGDESRMRDWIRSHAWGHHASGTCRMGPEGDRGAVLDSRFRVRGVSGLRVVDASIFPKIPGYFVVANIYMASEKASDVILEDANYGGPDTTMYPRDLRARETEALARRRAVLREAAGSGQPPQAAGGDWADDVTGLALSGGGVRSATFNLGVIQAMARGHWLRRVDFLSTVSGGGYIGAFLGQWFNRLRPQSEWGGAHQPVHDVPAQIERELNDPESPAVGWLRRHGNYLAPSGEGRTNAAVFVRNFLSVHFVIAALLLALLGVFNFIRYGALDPASAGLALALGMSNMELPIGWLLQALLGVFFSPWFVVFELVLLFMVVPRIAGYWIVSQDQQERFSGPPLAVLFLVSGALLYGGFANGLRWPLVLMGLAPLLAFIHVEFAWRRGKARELAIGRGNVETSRLRTRNYLTHDLGLALGMTAAAMVFAIIDTVGHGLLQWAEHNNRYAQAFAGLFGAAAALVPVAKYAAGVFAAEKPGPPSTIARLAGEQFRAGALATVLFVVPLVLVSFVSHAAFGGGAALGRGIAVTALALALTLIFAHRKALPFVNRSSLAQVYAARLARAYLGATNPVRFRPQGANVTEVVAGDDIASIRDYRPFVTGGPLHLINITVNQSVDFSSLRGNRDRKGENVAVSPIGMSVGSNRHAGWADPTAPAPDSGRKQPTRLEPLGHVPGTEHPLLDADGRPADSAEMLSLRQWIAISGAAVGPGRGGTTRLGTALLFGLANLRTGHWWNSGVTAVGRDGLPELTFLRRTAYAIRAALTTQALLLSEWIGRFPGPWIRHWYLTDGGFFENLGAYELIRRRVPRIIVCDASADPLYDMNGVANLMRKVRIDFAASIEPFTALDYAAAKIPSNVMTHLGTLEDLAPEMSADGDITGPSKKHAALFWVCYPPGVDAKSVRPSVLLYVKASLTGDESADVREYHKAHREFPHEGTANQFFNEDQWESYRCLGQHVLTQLCDDAWFWSIPLGARTARST